MKRVLLSTAAFAAATGAAMAGGLERTNQSVDILFEDGRYLELNFALVSPDATGVLAGQESGDILESYLNFGAAYKADLSDYLSYAIIYDQPYGANTNYPAGTTYPFTGSTAEVNSHALTGVLAYRMDNNVSLYGGLRAQSLQAEAVLPVIFYQVESNTDYTLGYLVGAAYERPDIALRVALTYFSETTHDLELTETTPGPAGTTTQEVSLPQAVNLEFQTGVAKDTLLFGSVRWAEWTSTVINPPIYAGGSPYPLVFFEDDRITYTLGLGRRLNETWSILGSLSYEESTGSVTGNLGPTDGFASVGLGAVYTKDNMKITGGVRYVEIGDATSFSGAVFENNTGLAAGVQVGFQF